MCRDLNDRWSVVGVQVGMVDYIHTLELGEWALNVLYVLVD